METNNEIIIATVNFKFLFYGVRLTCLDCNCSFPSNLLNNRNRFSSNTESNSVLKPAHVDAILLWYSGFSFDLRLINKINACREKTGLTIENRIDYP